MKPTFLVGKGAASQLEPMDRLVEHYRRIFRGFLSWNGLPEDCPAGFPQDALFFTGGVGCKRLKGFGPVLAGVSPSTLTVYGTPYHWIPRPIGMAMDLNAEFFQPSNDPCMYIGEPFAELIDPYIDIMSRAMKTLNQNLVAIQQPILVKGIPGSPNGGKITMSELASGELMIPSTGAGFNVEILDLKAQDHTQNLVSTIDWCDARILEALMSSNGVEKSSGITTMETVSGVQSIIQECEDLLSRARAFCDDVNDRFKLDMSVSEGRGMTALMTGSDDAEMRQDVEDE